MHLQNCLTFGVHITLMLHKRPNKKDIIDKKEFEGVFVRRSIYTYCKILSEEIFVHLDTEDKNLAYSPFQTLATYFLGLGYSGIIYKNTVQNGGKNIVLFDKFKNSWYNIPITGKEEIKEFQDRVLDDDDE